METYVTCDRRNLPCEGTTLDAAAALSGSEQDVAGSSPRALMLDIGASASHASLTAIVDRRLVDIVLVGKPVPVLWTSQTMSGRDQSFECGKALTGWAPL